MKSKCLSERLETILKRQFLGKSNLVAIKDLCNHANRQREAGVWSAQAHLRADAQVPGPAMHRSQ